jgi:hypothetical protein
VRRLILALGLIVALGAGAPVAAHDAYDDSESHPLRLAAYGAYPIGYLVEWVVMRPMHFVVSHPQLERIFGHVPHETPFGGYQPYEPDEDR